MKTLFSKFIIVFLLVFAVPQGTLAQTEAVVADENPGAFYVVREKGTSTFTEGNYWELSFSNIDTLGVVHDLPVQMQITGGLMFDTVNYIISEVDSVIMYRPETQVNPGVMNFTREHFDYFLSKEDTTLHISASYLNEFELPEVGQLVICDIFEEPIPYGVIGKVTCIEYQGSEILMHYTQSGCMTDYYKTRFYSTADEEAQEIAQKARARGDRRYYRRGIPAREIGRLKTGLTQQELNTIPWEANILSNEVFRDIDLGSLAVSVTDNVSITGSGTISLNGSSICTYEKADDNINGVQNRMSVTYKRYIPRVAFKGDVTGSISVALLGISKTKMWKGGRIRLILTGGLTLEGSLGFTGLVDVACPTVYTKEYYDESQGKTVKEQFETKDYHTNLNGLFHFDAGLFLGIDTGFAFGLKDGKQYSSEEGSDADEKNPVDFKVGVTAKVGIPHLTGTVNFNYSLEGSPTDHPYQLKENFDKINRDCSGIRLQFSYSASAYASFFGSQNENPDGTPVDNPISGSKGGSAGVNGYFPLLSIGWFPPINNTYTYCIPGDFTGSDEKYYNLRIQTLNVKLINYGYLGKSSLHYWFYNPQTAEFEKKIRMGYCGGGYDEFDSSKPQEGYDEANGRFIFDGEVKLTRGNHYDAYLVYGNSDTFSADAPTASFRVPYDMKPKVEVMQLPNTPAYLSMSCVFDVQALFDQDNTHMITDMYFKYQTKKGYMETEHYDLKASDFNNGIEKEFDDIVPFTTEYFSWEKYYDVTFSYKIDGEEVERTWSFQTPANPSRPVIQPAEDITCTSAKLLAKIDRTIYERVINQDNCAIWFEMDDYGLSSKIKKIDAYVTTFIDKEGYYMAANVNGLFSNWSYEAQAVVALGEVTKPFYSAELSRFKAKPYIENESAVSITPNYSSATVYLQTVVPVSQIISDECELHVHYCLENEEMTIDRPFSKLVVASSDNTMQTDVNGLTPGKKYKFAIFGHYRNHPTSNGYVRIKQIELPQTYSFKTPGEDILSYTSQTTVEGVKIEITLDEESDYLTNLSNSYVRYAAVYAIPHSGADINASDPSYNDPTDLDQYMYKMTRKSDRTNDIMDMNKYETTIQDLNFDSQYDVYFALCSEPEYNVNEIYFGTCRGTIKSFNPGDLLLSYQSNPDPLKTKISITCSEELLSFKETYGYNEIYVILKSPDQDWPRDDTKSLSSYSKFQVIRAIRNADNPLIYECETSVGDLMPLTKYSAKFAIQLSTRTYPDGTLYFSTNISENARIELKSPFDDFEIVNVGLTTATVQFSINQTIYDNYKDHSELYVTLTEQNQSEVISGETADIISSHDGKYYVQCSLNNLKPSTLYDVSLSIVIDEGQTLLTDANAYLVSTDDAIKSISHSNVTGSSAVLKAKIHSELADLLNNQNGMSAYFLYSDNRGSISQYLYPGTIFDEDCPTPGMVTIEGPYDSELKGTIGSLNPNTTYYYCLVVFGSESLGDPLVCDIKSFKTTNAYEVTSLPVTELADEHYSVVLNGKFSDEMKDLVNSEGTSVSAGFQYGFSETFPTNESDDIRTGQADINAEEGTFSYNTDYTRNDFLIGKGNCFYYRSVVELNGKKYFGKVLKAQIPEIFYVGESEHDEYDEYTCINFKIAPEVAYLGSLSDTDMLGNVTKRHSVIPFVNYSLTEEGLNDANVQSTSGSYNEEGIVTTDIYDMEYNSTYYFRCGLKVDDITVWGEVKTLETLEWDPDHGVDAPRRRPTHGQRARKRNLSQVSE